MSSLKWQGFLAPAALVAAAAAMSNGCSSSSGTNGAIDGGTGGMSDDSGPTVGRHADASFELDTGTTTPGVDASSATFDGTTGKACQSNADCQGGAGINVCSNSLQSQAPGNQAVNLWPTPVCLPAPSNSPTTGNCNPGPAGGLTFCDSADPTDPTSPGVCLPIASLTPPLNGVCLPACSFDTSGAAPTGCAGNDTCLPLTVFLTTSNAVFGVGVCQGTCQTDADCSLLGTSFSCQTDLGFCTRAKKTRTKALGAACTSNDATTGACNCIIGNTSTTGVCSSACVVGGAACPAGTVCDSFESSSLTFTGAGPNGADLVLPGPPKPTPGMTGLCIQSCTDSDAGTPAVGDAGDAGDAGGSATCPQGSSCQSVTAAGPDCQPI